jgi:hypothetical protein
VFSRKQGFVKTQPVPTVHCAPKSNVEENKEVPTKKNSVADPECLSRILDLNFFSIPDTALKRFQIPDPGSGSATLPTKNIILYYKCVNQSTKNK